MPTATPTPAPQQVSGFVGTSGTRLTLNGSTYRFTGLDVYNANSRWNCSYDMVRNDALDRALQDMGPGNEAIRAWFFQRLATTNGQRDWTAFDHTLSVAKAHGVRVIVTLADHWGACEDTGIKTEGWYASGYRTTVSDVVTYRDFVAQVVNRYRNDPTVLMWQMVNEAEVKNTNGACGSMSTLRSFAQDIGGLIKSIDSNHIVSLGTMGGGQCGTAGARLQGAPCHQRGRRLRGPRLLGQRAHAR